jgi:pectate lyase
MKVFLQIIIVFFFQSIILSDSYSFNKTITVSNVLKLQDAVLSVDSNTEILLEDGDYALSQTLVVSNGVHNVSIRGKSGNRESVTIHGKGMSNKAFGNVPHGFMIRNAKDVMISDLTIRDCYYHNVIAQSEQGAMRPVLRNVLSIDAG